MQMTLAPTLTHPRPYYPPTTTSGLSLLLCVFLSSIGLRIANMHKLLRDRLDLSKHILVPA